MNSRKTKRSEKEDVVIHAPGLLKHLKHFGIGSEHDEVVWQLSDLCSFADSEDMDDPKKVAKLRKQFPKGLKSRSIFRYECMNAGMGGCGTADVGVLFCPASGIEIVCWLDVENGDGDVFASADNLRTFFISPSFVECFLTKSFDRGMATVNGALSMIENLAPEVLTRQWFRELWQQTTQEGGEDVALAMRLFDECYRERRKRRPLMGV